MAGKINPKSGMSKSSFLFEVAWEVCNQVGGIYRVIHSKIHRAKSAWETNYCLLGPYFYNKALSEFEPQEEQTDSIGKAVATLRQNGYEVYDGYWLINKKPRVILFNPQSVVSKLGEIKYELWQYHHISVEKYDQLVDQVLAFGFLIKMFFITLNEQKILKKQSTIAHFHEWMAATALPEIRRLELPITNIFTTHATVLGRYLAMNDDIFYEHLPFYNWEEEAAKFNIETEAKLERAAAHGTHVFTTVSDVTARECTHLLGRKPDTILPNGLNISRFTALHELQNLHLDYKLKIHRFTIGHFFESDNFDLDKTLYFFTSGRYEYKNKGFDMVLEALARLNWQMKKSNIDKTIIMFIVTKSSYYSINPKALQNRALVNQIEEICKGMVNQISERLFYAVTAGNGQELPDFKDFIDDEWVLRLRKTIQTWKSNDLPPVVTHNLVDDSKDQVLQMIRTCQLFNGHHDKVKIIYHTDFITTANPLFNLDYSQFIRGCHLGIFPSYYEPWGYTPLECLASGVPAITSDLGGFGNYVLNSVKSPHKKGLYVVERHNKSYDQAAQQLTNYLLEFTLMNRRQRISQRNEAEETSVKFAWKELYKNYLAAYQFALEST